jgi:hypothetical protein
MARKDSKIEAVHKNGLSKSNDFAGQFPQILLEIFPSLRLLFGGN